MIRPDTIDGIPEDKGYRFAKPKLRDEAEWKLYEVRDDGDSGRLSAFRGSSCEPVIENLHLTAYEWTEKVGPPEDNENN